MTDAVNRPQLLSDTTAEASAAETIRTLNEGIYRQPEVFLQTLEMLGEFATENSVELHTVDEEHALDQLSSKSLTPEMLLIAYFSKRYDLESSFDPETETALLEDPSHAELRRKFMQTRTISKRKGVMGSVNATNPEAPAARNAVRRHRLAFYIARVNDWRTAIDSESKLPSAV